MFLCVVEGVGEGRAHIGEEEEVTMCNYVFYIDTYTTELYRKLNRNET